MTKGHQLAALRPLLLGIIVLLVSLGSLVWVVDKTPFLPPYLYHAHSYITKSSLQVWDLVSEVRVERVVSCASLTQWITVAFLLTSFWSFRVPKLAWELDEALAFAQVRLIGRDYINLAHNCPLNTKGSETTRLSNVPGVVTLKGITESDEIIHSTKGFENVTKSDTPGPVLSPDLLVFRVLQVETAANFPAPTSSIATSRSIDEDMESQTNSRFINSYAHDRSETVNASANLENHWRAVEIRPSLPMPNQPWQQQTTAPSTIPETNPAPLGPPLHRQQVYAPVIGGVSGLLNGNISIVRSSRSMEVQRPARTVDRSRGELPESVQYGNGHLDHSHTILSDVSRNRIINDIRSMDEGYPQHIQHIQHSHTSTPPTTALESSMPDGPLGQPPVSNARNQPYRPTFQPLTPALVRFTQAEQPWSSELQRPAASARRAKFRDDCDKIDALLN